MAIASPNGNGSRAFAADISRHGLTAEISLSGELDLAARGALRRAAAEALAERRTEVLLVDMTAVTFFDSAVAQAAGGALAGLRCAHARRHRRDRRLRAGTPRASWEGSHG
jgi:anti-anti-sigma factor